ncbi:hypothetical protein AYO38_02370 [bacterium SCGC AG-212-C10]|nr:hypothetical protein AYO38_02370 [bacterium SCGC AG-212-C10]
MQQNAWPAASRRERAGWGLAFLLLAVATVAAFLWLRWRDDPFDSIPILVGEMGFNGTYGEPLPGAAAAWNSDDLRVKKDGTFEGTLTTTYQGPASVSDERVTMPDVTDVLFVEVSVRYRWSEEGYGEAACGSMARVRADASNEAGATFRLTSSEPLTPCTEVRSFPKAPVAMLIAFTWVRAFREGDEMWLQVMAGNAGSGAGGRTTSFGAIVPLEGQFFVQHPAPESALFPPGAQPEFLAWIRENIR